MQKALHRLLITILLVGFAAPMASPAEGSPLSQQGAFAGWAFRVGPATQVTGPRSDPDTPVTGLATGAGVRIYTANGSTWRLDGPTIESLTLNSTNPVLSAGSAGAFDSCGAWLTSLARAGGIIRAWYHAETACHYTPPYSTFKSVGYAESYDGGLTFQKVGYPNNKQLSGPSSSWDGNQGAGDPSIVALNGFYYMYFYQTEVGFTGAIDTIDNYGRPFACPAGGWDCTQEYRGWRKWNNGSFSGTPYGSATLLNGVFIGSSGSASVWTSAGLSRIVYVGSGGADNPGLILSVSSDGATFTRLSSRLLLGNQEDWSRPAGAGELIVYPSLIAPSGEGAWSSSVYLFYAYIQPKEGTSTRYLVRRRIDLLAATPNWPQVRVALTRYWLPSPFTHWVTTALIPTQLGYQTEFTLGYLFTSAQSSLPMTELVDCTWTEAGKVHHLIQRNGACDNGSLTKLRSLGWAFTSPQPNTVAIYRCFWPQGYDHWVSTDPNCESTSARNEGLLGYIANQ